MRGNPRILTFDMGDTRQSSFLSGGFDIEQQFQGQCRIPPGRTPRPSIMGPDGRHHSNMLISHASSVALLVRVRIGEGFRPQK